MYSPKIDEALIPLLYHLGKARHMPMTRLVDSLIRTALAAEEPPREAPAPAAASKESDEAKELPGDVALSRARPDSQPETAIL